MKKSASLDGAKTKPAVVLEDAVIEGDINLPGGLCLFGKILGNIIAGGRVEVKPGALVTGNIFCRELDIEGTVEGNVDTHILAIGEKAVLKGDAQTGKLLVRAVKYDMRRLRLVRK